MFWIVWGFPFVTTRDKNMVYRYRWSPVNSWQGQTKLHHRTDFGRYQISENGERESARFCVSQIGCIPRNVVQWIVCDGCWPRFVLDRFDLCSITLGLKFLVFHRDPRDIVIYHLQLRPGSQRGQKSLRRRLSQRESARELQEASLVSWQKNGSL